jgi:farnesyl-diphosphate farnesyltransferase
LSNSLGTFLQKTNIIRDFQEDAQERRFFWPREIWSLAEYGPDGQTPATDVLQLFQESQRAKWVQSAMILDALRHACDALDYLRLLRNQSVFNFAAIPAAMAIATLDLCFMNSDMFERNIKIRKAKAADLIMRSTNPREVALIFKEYARSIHAKASPSDPNFLRISVACAKIDQWTERNYPSFVRLPTTTGPSSLHPSFDPADARSRVAIADAEKEKFASEERRRERFGGNGALLPSDTQSQGPPWEVLLFVGGAVFLIIALSIGIVLAVLYFTT